MYVQCLKNAFRVNLFYRRLRLSAKRHRSANIKDGIRGECRPSVSQSAENSGTIEEKKEKVRCPKLPQPAEFVSDSSGKIGQKHWDGG
jgi:hypothetical protein